MILAMRRRRCLRQYIICARAEGREWYVGRQVAGAAGGRAEQKEERKAHVVDATSRSVRTLEGLAGDVYSTSIFFFSSSWLFGDLQEARW